MQTTAIQVPTLQCNEWLNCAKVIVEYHQISLHHTFCLQGFHIDSFSTLQVISKHRNLKRITHTFLEIEKPANILAVELMSFAIPKSASTMDVISF